MGDVNLGDNAISALQDDVVTFQDQVKQLGSDIADSAQVDTLQGSVGALKSTVSDGC